MSETGTGITLQNLRKTFGQTEVIPDLSAEIEPGSFTVILGPSGCGKSTLLNMIAGLETVTRGTIRIGDTEVQDVEPKNRGIAMVFQNYALYPHMTVADNIGYALKVARVPKPERAARVAEAARVVELGEYLTRRPSELSGGQRQRVAIARAIVREPKVLLFDEPLSNLDAKLRHGMRMELSQLHRRIGGTSVFVTHDQVEAMTLADRIMILNKGRIEQYDTPKAVYDRPASTFVAGFIGTPAMNLLEVEGDGQSLCDDNGTALAPSARTGPLTLGIRPEHVQIAPDGIPVEILYQEDLGSHLILLLRLPGGQNVNLSTQQRPESNEAHIRIPSDAIRLFDRSTGQALND